MISIIVAFDKDRLIGRSDGSLPWHIAEDFKQFKKRTTGHVVVMGRRTWESLPTKPLPDRLNVVLDDSIKESRCVWSSPDRSGLWFVPSWEDALFVTKFQPIHEMSVTEPNEIFIIGGRMVYASALEQGIVDKMYISLVHGNHEGDVYFPEISDEWKWEKKQEYEQFDLYELTK